MHERHSGARENRTPQVHQQTHTGGFSLKGHDLSRSIDALNGGELHPLINCCAMSGIHGTLPGRAKERLQLARVATVGECVEKLLETRLAHPIPGWWGQVGWQGEVIQCFPVCGGAQEKKADKLPKFGLIELLVITYQCESQWTAAASQHCRNVRGFADFCLQRAKFALHSARSQRIAA